MTDPDPAAVEIYMDDGTWATGGELIRARRGWQRSEGLILWQGVTSWLYREQGRGRPDEWRYPAEVPTTPMESDD
jgi:hypothetical protein